MKIKKRNIMFATLLCILAAVIAFYFIGNSYIWGRQNTVRTVTIEKQEIDYQSILQDFEDSTLTIEDGFADFIGYKKLDSSIFEQLDNLSLAEKEEYKQNSTVKYHFTYDEETNIVTIEATMIFPDGTAEIDDITGVGFINSNNEIDAVMNIEGEGILLSEMQDAGMIENCGWFSRLVKNVVKVVAVVVVVAAVVAVTAAIVVATAGAAAPALVAAGVGVAGSGAVTAGAIIAGGAAGALFLSTIGKAALDAGTAFAEALGDGTEVLIDKVSLAVLEIIYKGASYIASVLTGSIVSKLSKNDYFMTWANAKDGQMYYSPTVITKQFAISIMNHNSTVSIYTYYESNARSVTQQAGDNKSPVYDYAHKVGYFSHYHLGNIPRDYAVAHAFFGMPRVS